ncbi:MAG: tetratricopeptide repeat protein [bacterium]
MKRKIITLFILFIALFVIGCWGNTFSQSVDEALRLYKALRLYNQGKEAKKYGRYQEALAYYERSLKICRDLNHLRVITANLNDIGYVYNSLGQYEKALNYYEEALKIKRENNLSPESIATSLNNIGFVYCSLGQYEKALNYLEEALKIYRELNIPQYIAISLNNIGLVYHHLGQYDKALNYYEEALKIVRQLNIPQYIAISLNDIGLVYDSLGQYEKALNYYEEALKIRRQLNIPQYIATSLNNIGAVYSSLGQYEKALNYYEEALKIYRELNIPQDIATSLNNIGYVYYFLGQYEKALSYFEEALKIRKELNIPQDIAISLNNIGDIYLSQKRYKEAEKYFSEAKGRSGFVELYIATGRHNEALNLLKEMAPKWNTADPYRIQVYTQNGLGLKGMGKFKEASAEFLQAVSISEEMRARIKGEKAGFFGAGYYGGRIRSYKGLISTLSERVITGETIDERFKPYGKDLLSTSFYFAESTRARVLLEAIAESVRGYFKSELPPEIKNKEEDILNRLSAIEEQWTQMYTKGEDVFKEWVKRKETLKKELDVLISNMRREYPRYASLNYPKPIPVEELPLKENEILLEYAICDDATYLFVVSKGKVERLIKIPKDKEGIEALVEEFVLPLQSPYTQEDFSPFLGQSLYCLLLEDALKGISPDKEIIIIPDGILGLLPFEALVISTGKDYRDSLYVGDKYKTTYCQSASILALNRMLKPSQASKILFALGNPIYDKNDPRYIAYKKGQPQPTLLTQNLAQYAYRGLATRREWGKTSKDDKEGKGMFFIPLPETEDEVRAIAGLFGVKSEPPDVLLNIYANETNLRKATLKNYRYLHFATHADLPGKVQGIKEPFLLLGQVENKGEDDGFLTLTEVLGLSLDADIVVLSACLTGRGKVMEGEGVVNFARAFQHAGARSVLVSLWEVASKETGEYMELFYQHLKQGKTRGEALRLARNEIKKKYPNPFYWAPFILHGER